MGSSPPDGGEQTLPHSVSPITVVVQEVLPPLTGQDLSENDFILIKPVPPEIKVSSLKSAMFYLPDAKIFIDKCLPDHDSCFIEIIVPISRFSPDYLTGLHNLVNAPGQSYPEGTFNYLGARISWPTSTLISQLGEVFLQNIQGGILLISWNSGFPSVLIQLALLNLV